MTAKELSEDYDDRITKYLVSKGWYLCEQENTGGLLVWIRIFEHANDGTKYKVPLLKIVNSIHTALTIQRVREEKAAEAAGVKG